MRILLRFARNNVIALVALFVALGTTGAYAANTIYSTDIVDGQVKNQDLAANSVATGKIVDGSIYGWDIAANAVTGREVNEATLAQVPDSAKLGGVAAVNYRQFTRTTTVATSDCVTQIQTWTGCAPITINVPSGHTYSITVESMVNVDSSTTQTLGFCAADQGPQCLDFLSRPELLTAWAGAYTMGMSSFTWYVAGPSTFVAQTAIKLGAALNASPNAKTTTRVDYYDASAEAQTATSAHVRHIKR